MLGVAINNTYRAYPIRYLNIHEVVNDRIEDQHFTVSFCPLCGSGVLFATNINLADGKTAELNFGVSGLLYNSDLLMYDRNTQSLWSQISAEAISGPMVATKLPILPVWHTTWASWQERHPQTQIMHGDKRFAEAYKTNPYPNYKKKLKNQLLSQKILKDLLLSHLQTSFSLLKKLNSFFLQLDHMALCY